MNNSQKKLSSLQNQWQSFSASGVTDSSILAPLNQEIKQEMQNLQVLKSQLSGYKNQKFYQELDAKRQSLEDEELDDPNFENRVEDGRNAKLDGQGLANSRGKEMIRYIRDSAYRQAQQQGAVNAGVSAANPYVSLEYLTPVQRDTLPYYAGKGDYAIVEKYFDSIRYGLNEKKQSDISEKTTKMAEDSKLYGVAENLNTAYTSSLAYADTAAQGMQNAVTGEYAPVDTNSAWFSGTHTRNDTEAGLTKDMSEFGKVVTSMGLSLGRTGMTLPLGATGSVAVMASSEAGQIVLDVMERGGTTEQALFEGTTQGIVEFFSRQLPLKHLSGMVEKIASGATSAGKLASGIAANVGIQGSTGMVGYFTNLLTDMAVMGDKSRYEYYVREKMAQGYSAQDAQDAATFEFFVKQLATSLAFDTVASLIFSGAGSVVGNAGFKANLINLKDQGRIKLEKSHYKIINKSTAQEANDWWKNVKGYEPPYMQNTSTNIMKLKKDTKFVRVYDGEGSDMRGNWIMEADEITGLTPTQIQNKFALPFTPMYVCDVELSAGARLRLGTVNSLFEYEGGGLQYDMMGQYMGNFSNERLIGDERK